MLDAILFDLDGTLLPMVLEEFTTMYFGLLAKKLAPFGYEPKPLIDAVWKGTYAMMKNDGSKPNCDVFWETFFALMGQDKEKDMDKFNEFYAVEFNGAISSTQPTPLARQLVDAARAKAKRVILATNPLFPRVGVISRLGWLDLKEEDFDYITTYDNSSYCKPNPMYFTQLLEKCGVAPETCIMFGNDMDEDAQCAAAAGLKAYLVTDCLINKNGAPMDFPHGTLAEALEYIKNL